MPPRLFAVVPAAGHSRRMGQPKLLLSLGGLTVIARLLSVLRAADIVETVVVLRPDDEELRAAVAAAGASALQPGDAPPDMRRSVQLGLAYLAERHELQPDDGWLLIPADHPLLAPELLRTLLAEWEASAPRALVPSCAGRRGHPTLFRWSFAAEVAALAPDEGLNQILRRHADEVRVLPVDDPAVLLDLDTPEDYARLCRGFEA